MERTASRIPTNPAKVLQTMKLRISTVRTRTPASAAAILFEPTDTVCRPHRVRVSANCMTTITMIAQISSE